jgi:hypothetical protein
MSRTDSFNDRPRDRQLPRNLRNNAREAAEYLTGLKPDRPDDSHVITRQKYGRGANGESAS